MAADAKDLTPLHYACMGGHAQCVELILAAGGADAYREKMEAAGDSGAHSGEGAAQRRVVNSPLHWAVQRGHVRVVWLLLAAGFSGLDLDVVGNSSLHLAASCGLQSRSTQVEVIKALMHAGAMVGQ
jgi:ankyrin repeat protein